MTIVIMSTLPVPLKTGLDTSGSKSLSDLHCKCFLSRTWSGVQNMIKAQVESEVEALIEQFTNECSEILGVGDRRKLMETEIELRTRYWITLYQK